MWWLGLDMDRWAFLQYLTLLPDSSSSKILNIINIWLSNLADQEATFLPTCHLQNYEHIYNIVDIWSCANIRIFHLLVIYSKLIHHFLLFSFMMNVEILSQLFWECKLLSSFHKWKKKLPIVYCQWQVPIELFSHYKLYVLFSYFKIQIWKKKLIIFPNLTPFFWKCVFIGIFFYILKRQNQVLYKKRSMSFFILS